MERDGPRVFAAENVGLWETGTGLLLAGTELVCPTNLLGLSRLIGHGGKPRAAPSLQHAAGTWYLALGIWYLVFAPSRDHTPGVGRPATRGPPCRGLRRRGVGRAIYVAPSMAGALALPLVVAEPAAVLGFVGVAPVGLRVAEVCRRCRCLGPPPHNPNILPLRPCHHLVWAGEWLFGMGRPEVNVWFSKTLGKLGMSLNQVWFGGPAKPQRGENSTQHDGMLLPPHHACAY